MPTQRRHADSSSGNHNFRNENYGMGSSPLTIGHLRIYFYRLTGGRSMIVSVALLTIETRVDWSTVPTLRQTSKNSQTLFFDDPEPSQST